MKLSISDIRDRAKDRPRGYVADVLSRGTVDGEWLEISDVEFVRLVEKYGGGGRLWRFANAMRRWARSGFRFVGAVRFAARLRICRSCEYWRRGAILGRCGKCGCYSVKLRLATERCPVSKW